MSHLYLDNNATTFLHPAVAQAMAQCYRDAYANAASQHAPARRARQQVEDAREGIAEILGAATGPSDADQVVFTSGGTEANNLALRGLMGRDAGHLVVAAIEHPSVMDVARQMEREGCRLDTLPVDADGVVLVDQLPQLIRTETRLVSVMLGNSETGVLQPVAAAAAHCRAAGIPLHTDAVQAVGKIAVDFRRLGTTTLSISAHKFHGPRGIGALIVRHEARVEPQLFGGFQQLGLRPGTEPVELIVGMWTALRIWQQEAGQRELRMRRLRDRFELLLAAGDPSIVIHGRHADRLPNTSNASFPGADRQAMLMALDLAEVACSTGTACASGSSEPSPVLLAMGLDEGLINSAIRFSFSALSDEGEVDRAASRILKVYGDLRRQNGARKRPASSRNASAKGV